MNDTIPSEFAGFVRETGIRAFDMLASRSDIKPPIRTLLRGWSKLSQSDKERLFDELIATFSRESSGADDDVSLGSSRPDLRRYDPDEVARTLPKRTTRRRTKPAETP